MRGEPEVDGEAEPSCSLRADLATLHDDAWHWALNCCRGDREIAMETLHDSYLSILDGRARFAGRSSFKTFAFGVIRWTAIATRRKAGFRALLTAPLEAAAPVSVPATQEASARMPRVDAALGRLTNRQRNVVELVLLHDLSVAEAAEVLGISRGSASRHYALAKERLRGALGATEDGDE
ncbi:MAG: sigma-70 family RNA polymerase sigma factor [Pseudomonadota bacterium]